MSLSFKQNPISKQWSILMWTLSSLHLPASTPSSMPRLNSPSWHELHLRLLLSVMFYHSETQPTLSCSRWWRCNCCHWCLCHWRTHLEAIRLSIQTSPVKRVNPQTLCTSPIVKAPPDLNLQLKASHPSDATQPELPPRRCRGKASPTTRLRSEWWKKCKIKQRILWWSERLDLNSLNLDLKNQSDGHDFHYPESPSKGWGIPHDWCQELHRLSSKLEFDPIARSIVTRCTTNWLNSRVWPLALKQGSLSPLSPLSPSALKPLWSFSPLAKLNKKWSHRCVSIKRRRIGKVRYLNGCFWFP